MWKGSKSNGCVNMTQLFENKTPFNVRAHIKCSIYSFPMDGSAFTTKIFIYIFIYIYIPEEKKHTHQTVCTTCVSAWRWKWAARKSTRSAMCGCVCFSLHSTKTLCDRLTLFTYVGKHNFDLINCLVQREMIQFGCVVCVSFMSRITWACAPNKLYHDLYVQ